MLVIVNYVATYCVSNYNFCFQCNLSFNSVLGVWANLYAFKMVMLDYQLALSTAALPYIGKTLLYTIIYHQHRHVDCKIIAYTTNSMWTSKNGPSTDTLSLVLGLHCVVFP